MPHRRSFLAGLIGAALPLGGARAVETVGFDELFVFGQGVTDRARALEGRTVAMSGYMAPPLRADARFFVLTAAPMPLCPFCDSEGDWPESIIPVLTRRAIEVVPFYTAITARGTLVIGTHEDSDTGFVSPMRIVEATYETL
jgi:hypothetical protein